MDEENNITLSDSSIAGSDSSDIKKDEIVHELKEEKKEEEIYVDADLRVKMSIDVNLGRLKKTLSEKCPECGTTNLQLRVRQCETLELGESVLEDETYKYCPTCDLEFDYEEKRVRRKRDRANRDIELDDKRDGGRNASRYQKRGSVESRDGKNNRKGFRQR